MADDKVWLECLLKRKAYEEKPIRILECKGSSAIGKNENFFSEMTKMEATVLLGSGKTKNVSMMVKNIHTTEHMQQMTHQLGVFVREIIMYRDILPKMADLMEKYGDQEEPMWPKCYDFRLYSQLTLEDLSTRGFKMGNRFKQLSLDSCLLVVKNLAKFHGLSHILLKRGDIPLQIFAKYPFMMFSDDFHKTNLLSYNNLLKSIDAWGDDWKDVRNRFVNAMPTLQKKMEEALTPTKDDFVVLCHGDCWNNNFLFQNAPDSETAVSMKFVDFQMCFAASASFDLEHMFVTSLPTEIYKNNLDLILQTYSDALKSTMLKLNYEGPVPDFHAMKLLMKRNHIIYLFNSITSVPFHLGESQDIPNLEDVYKDKHDGNLEGGDGRLLPEGSKTDLYSNCLLNILVPYLLENLPMRLQSNTSVYRFFNAEHDGEVRITISHSVLRLERTNREEHLK